MRYTEETYDTPSRRGISRELSLNKIETAYTYAHEDELKKRGIVVFHSGNYTGKEADIVRKFMYERGFECFDYSYSYRIGVCQLYPGDEIRVKERERELNDEVRKAEEEYDEKLWAMLPPDIYTKVIKEEYDDSEVKKFFKNFQPKGGENDQNNRNL